MSKDIAKAKASDTFCVSMDWQRVMGWTSLGVMIASLGLVVIAVYGQEQKPEVSIELVRQYYSHDRPVALVHDYVYFDINLRNTGKADITEQKLWTRFISTKTQLEDSFFVFSIPSLAAGEIKKMHLGPYKLREPGMYHLFVGINANGTQTQPNEVEMTTPIASDVKPHQPWKFVMAYNVAMDAFGLPIIGFVVIISIMVGVMVIWLKKVPAQSHQ